jgi:heptosyltransferase-3
MDRCAVFCCMGLGDGLISLVLSNNLQRSGRLVTTYHPFLSGLKRWLPSLEIESFPEAQDLEKTLSSFDHIFIFFEKSPAMASVIEAAHRLKRDKVTILNPIATKKTDYPFWVNGGFSGSLPFAKNLQNFCRDKLGIKDATLDCGITAPSIFTRAKYAERVVIHPTSSREGKNWGEKRFALLVTSLRRRGYIPSVILTEKEKLSFPLLSRLSAEVTTLDEMAAFIYESGYMIGNDSGIGHLASALGLPTVTIGRSKLASDFWRPSWSKGCCVHPPSWIPNFKGMRLRDKYWKRLIPVRSVAKAFFGLVQTR